jgi:hypothetical protein
MLDIPVEHENIIREKVIQSLLALTIPPSWSPDFTLRYIVNYIGADIKRD